MRRAFDSQKRRFPARAVEHIRAELATPAAAGLKFRYGVPQRVALNYQEPPPPGKATGRYIGQPDRGDVVDEIVPCGIRIMHLKRGTLPSQYNIP